MYAGADMDMTHDVYTTSPSVRDNDRLSYKGRTLRVISVRRMDERRGMWHVQCLETDHG